MLAMAAVWNLTATAASAVAQWAVLAACARLAGAEALGELAWAAALVLPLHLVAGLQQRTALGAKAPGGDGNHLRLRLATGLVVIVAVAVWAWAPGLPATVAVTALWLAAARAAEGLGEVPLGRLQHGERFAAIAVLQAIRAGLIGLGALAGLMWWGGAVGAAAGWCAGSCLALGAAELPRLRRDPAVAPLPLPAWSLFLRLWPLGVSLGLAALVGSIPRLVLGEVEGARGLAWYAAAATVAALVAQVAGAAAPATSTRIAASPDPAAIRRLHRHLMCAAVVVALGAAAVAWGCGGWGLALLFGPDFATAGTLLALLCVVSAVDGGAMAAGTVLTARGAWLHQVPMLVAAAAVALAVAWLAVPRWGAWGAVAALAAAHALRWVWGEALVARLISRLPAPAPAGPPPPPR
jgi:O-antigen/teichoic acid export membrane protein